MDSSALLDDVACFVLFGHVSGSYGSKMGTAFHVPRDALGVALPMPAARDSPVVRFQRDSCAEATIHASGSEAGSVPASQRKNPTWVTPQ